MIRRVVILMVLLAAAAACTRTDKPAGTAVAPDFVLPDLGGKDVRLTEFKGRVVVVEFWATWCPPCRESIPGMVKLYQAYRDKGLVVLGVSLDTSGVDAVRSFSEKNGINYPVLQGNDDIAAKYMVRGIPTLVLVNKEGLIARQYLGGADEDVLEKDVRALL